MKNIKEYLNESILDDEEDLINDDSVEKQQIIDWILKHYYIYDKNNIEILPGYLVNINNDNMLVTDGKITHLTNGLFKFNKINNGWFDCSGCKYLIDLNGGPREIIGGNFVCEYCNKLTDLNGAPKIIRKNRKYQGDFSCSYCENLTTLKGVPDRVDGEFKCQECPKLKNYAYAKHLKIVK